MKKYYIILGITIVFLAVSFIYKVNISNNIFKHFPYDTDEKNTNDENKFQVYVFFNKNTCKSCMGVIQVLNRLPDQFKVYGVVPGQDLEIEPELRYLTGVNFELLSLKKFRKFRPLYLPSLLGVFGGKIYFLIPATSGTKDDIFNILMSFYYAATPIFFE